MFTIMKNLEGPFSLVSIHRSVQCNGSLEGNFRAFSVRILGVAANFHAQTAVVDKIEARQQSAVQKLRTVRP
jgi:hypothetical protein